MLVKEVGCHTSKCITVKCVDVSPRREPGKKEIWLVPFENQADKKDSWLVPTRRKAGEWRDVGQQWGLPSMLKLQGCIFSNMKKSHVGG